MKMSEVTLASNLTAKRLPVDVSVQVIEYLGGSAAVSRYCGVNLAAVSQWKKNGIPRARLMYLREKFKDLPVMKSPEVINF